MASSLDRSFFLTESEITTSEKKCSLIMNVPHYGLGEAELGEIPALLWFKSETL